MSDTILITGASSGFGAMTARHLAMAGHTVYASMRQVATRNAEAVADAAAFAQEHGVDLRTIEMDVSSQESVDAAVAAILGERGAIDVVVHNAGHMVLGPLEAFTPEELAAVYDTNVLSTQRVNRAVLGHMRDRRSGLLVWVGSSSTRGGTPPFLGPYFAAKAAEDSVAVTYAAELARFGIETTIVVPGAFTTGTNHFANAGHPQDRERAEAYDELYGGLSEAVAQKLAEETPADADPEEVARQIAHVVGLPRGRRPFRVHIDPLDDGAEEVNALGDRVRERFYHRVGLADLLSPAAGDDDDAR
jgi:NAD(P)-dependent dehydrogenase (short-subunit alcohol dehydrogenase family)